MDDFYYPMDAYDFDNPNTSDWIETAELRLKNSDDQVEAILCLGRAEYAVNSASDWCLIAESWINLFEGDSQARRCMEQAAFAATGVIDKLLVAEKWVTTLSDVAQAQRNIINAERLATTALDWLMIARNWIRFVNDNARALTCMAKAGDRTQTQPLNKSTDWLELRQLWLVYDNEYEARRCLIYAMGTASRASEWEMIAAIWDELGAQRLSEQCVRKAKELRARDPWGLDDFEELFRASLFPEETRSGEEDKLSELYDNTDDLPF